MVVHSAQKTRKRRLEFQEEEHSTQHRAAKKPKPEIQHRYSARFWDSLSHVPVTRGALKELERRCVERAVTENAETEPPRSTSRILRSDYRRLITLATSGGPDLTSIRGYPSGVNKAGRSVEMSQSSSQTRKRSLGSSTSKSNATSKTKTTTPYGAEFEQKLIDMGVYPNGYRTADGGRPSKPENFDELRGALSQTRASLSPSQFSEGAFENFQEVNQRANSESKAMVDVIPTIVGDKKGKSFESSGNVPFTRLEKFDEDLSTPMPDIYYGAKSAQIDIRVRRELDKYITPSNRTTLPAAPNFFFEGKSAAGRPDVAQRQAMYNGAIGARGMLHLQNYGNSALTFDGNAYTMSATYSDGQLRMYATHPKQSQAHNRTEYHMTQLRAYAMTDTSDSFRQGAAAYRNARDWTKQQRDRFITDANAVVRGRSTETSLTISQNTQYSVDNNGSVTSDTSMDELSFEYEQKRQRKRGNPRVE